MSQCFKHLLGFPMIVGEGSSLVFSAPLTHSILPDKGNLLLFTRGSSSEATITDFEGDSVKVPEQGARFYGSRLVRNLLTVSDTSIPNSFSTQTGGTVSWDELLQTLNTDAINSGIRTHQDHDNININSGQRVVLKYEIEHVSGATNWELIALGTAGRILNSKALSLITGTRLWYSGGIAEVTSEGTIRPSLRVKSNNVTELKVYNCQFELMTGSMVDNNDEYVDVGVGVVGEISADPNFLDQSKWDIVDGGWSVSGGLAAYDGSGVGFRYLYQTDVLRVGALYIFEIVIESCSDFARAGLVTNANGSVASFSTLGITTLGRHVIQGEGRLRVSNSNRDYIRVYGRDSDTVSLSSLKVREVRHGSNADGLKYFPTDRSALAIADNDLKGILIEKASTNLFEDSENLLDGSGAWEYTRLGSNPVRAGIEVDLVPDIGSDTHYFLNKTSVTSGSIYSQTFEVKPNGLTVFLCGSSTGFPSNGYINFVLVGSGSIGLKSAEYTGTIELLASGFYRCSLTVTSSSTSGGGQILLQPVDIEHAERLPTWSPDGVSGITFRYPQIEESIVPSSYIPTRDSSVIRDSESLSFVFPPKLNKQNVDYSYSFEAFLPVEANRYDTAKGMFALGDTPDRSQVKFNTSGNIVIEYFSNSEKKSIVDSTDRLRGRIKIAVSYDSSTGITSVSINGETVLTNTPAAVNQDFTRNSNPALWIGSTTNDGNIGGIPVKDVIVENLVLTPTELVERSTL